MKRRVKKQSGDRASSIAAEWLRNCRGMKAGDWAYITVGPLKTLCASVLSQDETKGKRRK